FAPHMDMGDYVVVVNADKVALNGAKLEQKHAYRHSGYPGGLTSTSYAELLEKNPVRAVEKAIKGMLPSNRLSDHVIKKLKVYEGTEYPRVAQQLIVFIIDHVAQYGPPLSSRRSHDFKRQ